MWKATRSVEMIYGYLQRLYAKRAQLEAQLELYEARSCFGDEEVSDGTDVDLRDRIDEISTEIEALEHSHNT